MSEGEQEKVELGHAAEPKDSLLSILDELKTGIDEVKSKLSPNEHLLLVQTVLRARLEQRSRLAMERNLVCFSRNDLRNIALAVLSAGEAERVGGGESDPIKPNKTQAPPPAGTG